MEKTRAIGLDIGTSTISAIVMDGKSGELLESITKQNNTNIVSKNSWEKTQDPAEIIDYIKKIVAELEQKYAPVACIGLTGQMHGIVYLDMDGNALGPFYTWQDGRGNLEYRDGISYADYLSKVTGYKLSTGFGAVTHFYNVVNGLVPESAVSFCTIHDYVALKLTKVSRPILHPTNAASIGIFNLEGDDFDRPAIVTAGMDDAIFPRVLAGIEIIGTSGAQTPVAITIGDNQASFMGSVNDNEKCLSVNIGTSGQISLFVDHVIRGSQIEIRPFTKGGFLLVGSTLCGGRAYALLESFFRSVIQMATGATPPSLYDVMNELANASLSVENKLEISTKFSGTRENPGQRGKISNINIDNFTPRHFIVGVLEGIVEELHTMYEIMGPDLTRKPKILIGSGNAIRLCKPLQRVVSEAFNMPINVPLYKEEAGYGAALFALVAAGYYKNLPEAQSLVRYE